MATYLVTQATGQQSQWVIKHLLAEGASVHAVVRNPEKIPPTLALPGVTIFKGESHDLQSILKAAHGCKGAFLNTFPIPGLEAQQAKTIVEACVQAGVESIVAATTLCTGNKAMWDNPETKECHLYDYFVSKAEVEAIVRSADVKAYTILRPAFIHFDYLLPSSEPNFPRLSKAGILDHAYDNGGKMPQTDANDIGRYAAAALQNPQKFAGKEIELSNEVLSIEEVREIIVGVSGRDIQLAKVAVEKIEEAKLAWSPLRFHLWANSSDFNNLKEVSKEVQDTFNMPFTSLESALKRDRKQLLDCLPA